MACGSAVLHVGIRRSLAGSLLGRNELTAREDLSDLGLNLLRCVKRAEATDAVEVRIEEAAHGALAELMQGFEILEVGVERMARRRRHAGIVQCEAVKPQTAKFAVSGAVRQAAVIDEAIDECDRAKLGQEARH